MIPLYTIAIILEIQILVQLVMNNHINVGKLLEILTDSRHGLTRGRQKTFIDVFSRLVIMILGTLLQQTI